jgi:eukaryotic-like serine/threonine-protein kinase
VIDRVQWQRLSALIDEGWALEGAAREAWLETLAAREPGIAEQVRSALAPEPEAETTSGFSGRYAQSLAAALQDTPAPELAGTRLGAWRLESKIGEGGMGQVWLARRDDGLYQGEAAIKLLRGDIGSTALAARFARERALLARLSHPAIARLLDAGIADASAGALSGQAYLVLELAPGETMNAHIRRHAPLLAQRVRLLVRVAEAVEYAHARLVVHRDLKPSNVLITADGSPKLLDFGVAALLDDDQTSAPSGELTRIAGRGLTLAYAAPEQITGAPIGTAADVFSLGVMLYELTSGVLPFGARGHTRTALEYAVLHNEPRRPSAAGGAEDPDGPGVALDHRQARGDLDAIVSKALRKDPGDRYASVRAFVDDLEAWLDHRPVSARRDNWRHNTRLFLRRHALLTAAVVLVMLSLGAGLATSIWQRQKAVQAARLSDEVTQYLGELLASASPDNHGGNWPTVLQLLEKSRADLNRRFADSPDTRLRVLHVLAKTYQQLNRLDVALPLAQQLAQETTARYGLHDVRTLQANYEVAQVLQLSGQCDLAVGYVEPALAGYRALPPHAEDELALQAVSLATLCASRLGQWPAAERLLDEERRMIDRLPADDPWHMGYYVHLTVLRSMQGRFGDALEAIRHTQPFWSTTAPEYQREVLTQQMSLLAMQSRVADYAGWEARSADLLERMERLAGPGNGMGRALRGERARYYLESGRYADALREREDAMAAAQAAKIESPAVLLPLQAQLLVNRAAAAVPAETLQREARDLFERSLPLAGTLGVQRAEVWLALARVALACDDAALAGAVLTRMQGDTGLHLAPGPGQDASLASRKSLLDGELARLNGDLAASRKLLGERLAFYDRGNPEQTVPAWSTALDAAYTAVLAGAADARQALEQAARRRPAGVAAGHPLDAAAAYLAARLEAGRDDTPAVQQAAAALRRAQGGDAPAAGLRGSLGGALL